MPKTTHAMNDSHSWRTCSAGMIATRWATVPRGAVYIWERNAGWMAVSLQPIVANDLIDDWHRLLGGHAGREALVIKDA